MKLKNGTIFVCKEPLQRLVDREDLPVKYGIKVVRLARKVNEEIASIESMRNNLIKKYGEEKDGKIQIKEDSENFPKFVVEYTELMDSEVDLEFEKIVIPDNLIVPTKDLATLEPFIEIENAEA
jgi:hypothetical protein